MHETHHRHDGAHAHGSFELNDVSVGFAAASMGAMGPGGTTRWPAPLSRLASAWRSTAAHTLSYTTATRRAFDARKHRMGVRRGVFLGRLYSARLVPAAT